MKYKLLTITYCLALLPVFGQNPLPFKLGVELMGTSSQISWVGLETNPNGVQLPSTHFRPGLGVGFRAKIASSGKFYIPVNINFNLNAFAVKTNGPVLIRQNNQLVAVQVDYYDYRYKQLVLNPAIGYMPVKWLGLEGGPYVSNAFNSMEVSLGDYVDWQKSTNFQQKWDYGVTAALSINYKKIYSRLSYCYGLKTHEEFRITDELGLDLGFLSSRNSGFSASLGFWF